MLIGAEYILIAVGRMFIFGKMGEARWKGLIPVYSEYLLFKHCWSVQKFWFFFFTVLGMSAVSLAASLIPDTVDFLKPDIWLVADLVILIVGLVCSIAFLITWVILQYSISSRFGHGIGFTIGLLLFPFIFYMILGFNKDEFRPLPGSGDVV